MKIKEIEIEGILGIKEKEITPGKINIISGKTGSGKTSIIDAIGALYGNKNKRGEIVNKEYEKGEIYIKHDDGSEVTRKFNKEGNSNVPVYKKGKQKFKKPNTVLKELFGESAFLPSSFMEKSKKEQKNILLAMIPMTINEEEFEKDFKGRKKDTETHALEVYKNLEKEIYEERTVVNAELKANQDAEERLSEQLPRKFDADKWEKTTLSELSKKLIESQKINENIAKGEIFLETFEKAIKEEIEKEKKEVKERFEKINKRALLDLENLKKEIAIVKDVIEKGKERSDEELKSNINDFKAEMDVKKFKCKSYLEKHEKVDIESLQIEIEETEAMKNLVPIAREHEKVLKECANSSKEKAILERQLENARNNPQKMLKEVKMPIEGLGVNEKGLLTINGLDISNLSDGEQWKLVCKIAMAEIEKNPEALKVICLDGFEKLNEEEQEKFVKELEETEFQFFITKVTDGELEIETR